MSRTKLIKQFDTDELFDEALFRKDIEISLSDFNRSVVEHSALHYKYGKISRIAAKIQEKAKLKVESSKKYLEQTLAEVSEMIRKEKKEAKDSFTIDQIKNEALSSRKYQGELTKHEQLREELIEIQFEASILELAESIFSKRTNLLNTLGWSMSSERRSDLEIRTPMDRSILERDIEEKKRVMEAQIRKSKQRRVQRGRKNID